MSEERLKVTSLTDFSPWIFWKMVMQMRRIIPSTRETIPVGMAMKERMTTTRAAKRKLSEFFSSILVLFFQEMAKGLRKDRIKARVPMIPVVVIRVKIKLLDSEKRIVQMSVFRLR